MSLRHEDDQPPEDPLIAAVRALRRAEQRRLASQPGSEDYEQAKDDEDIRRNAIWDLVRDDRDPPDSEP